MLRRWWSIVGRHPPFDGKADSMSRSRGVTVGITRSSQLRILHRLGRAQHISHL